MGPSCSAVLLPAPRAGARRSVTVVLTRRGTRREGAVITPCPGQWAVQPPSRTSVVPVTDEVNGPQR